MHGSDRQRDEQFLQSYDNGMELSVRQGESLHGSELVSLVECRYEQGTSRLQPVTVPVNTYGVYFSPGPNVVPVSLWIRDRLSVQGASLLDRMPEPKRERACQLDPELPSCMQLHHWQYLRHIEPNHSGVPSQVVQRHAEILSRHDQGWSGGRHHDTSRRFCVDHFWIGRHSVDLARCRCPCLALIVAGKNHAPGNTRLTRTWIKDTVSPSSHLLLIVILSTVTAV